jgi:hypothetical protein
MEKDAAQLGTPAMIIIVIILIIGGMFLFPAVCRSIPLQMPGLNFDFCFFFR